MALVPDSAWDESDDAAFLSSSYGLTPDEWQLHVLRGWLGRRADGRWSAPRCGLAVPRQNGKNGILEVRELYGMVALGERFLHTAHEVKTARKAFLRLLSFFENERQYPELAALVKEIRKTNGQEAIVLANGGSVEFVARSKGSGRGFTVDVLVMDEAQELSDDALAALLPTISASPTGNPQTIVTGTPPAPNMTGEVFTRTRNAGVAGEDRRLAWHEWSLTGDADPDDRANWAATNPALGRRLNPETIADERASMDDETFLRERLGVWAHDGVSYVIDPAVWADLADPSSGPEGRVVFAVDVSPDRRSTSIAVAGVRSDGVGHVEVVENRGGTSWAADRLAELSKKWRSPVVLDPAGPVGSLIPELERLRVKVVKTSGREMAQACGLFYDTVGDRRLRHLDDPRLNAALAGARRRNLGDAWAWHRKESADITPLVAVTLAWFGFQSFGAKRRGSGPSKVVVLA